MNISRMRICYINITRGWRASILPKVLIFLKQEINELYKENLQKLSNFVMVKFLKDTMVIPLESEWFGFYAPGQDVEVETLQESALYLEVSIMHHHLLFYDICFFEDLSTLLFLDIPF